VKIEVEMGVMLPQATKYQELTEARSGEEGFYPRALRLSIALPPHFFQISGLQKSENIFLLFMWPSLWLFNMAAIGN
jgi:hypothetical protein